MTKLKNEEDILRTQPIDKIDKNMRHIFGLLVEKDWATAASLIKIMMGSDDAAVKQVASGFTELIRFLKDLSAGKELRAAIKYLDSIILNNDIENLLPAMDEEDREKLKADIESNGIIAPLIVQETPEGLLLIDGYTRYRIAKELSKTKVPIVSISNVLDPKMTALMVNLSRRHMTREQRNELIKALPVPKAGRPKKGEEVNSAKKLAKQLGLTEEIVENVRREPRKDSGINSVKNGIKSKKLKKICTPPDAVAPLMVSEESKTGVDWFPAREHDIFRKQGYVKGIGYAMRFTKDQVNYDFLAKNTENCMNDLLRAIKKAGLEDIVDHYEMLVSFEARKRTEEK
jgi:hypothetical protein